MLGVIEKEGNTIEKVSSRVGRVTCTRHWSKPLAPTTMLTSGCIGTQCQGQEIVTLTKRGLEHGQVSQYKLFEFN